MRMRIKRANVKRLASLSALGAGALAMTAGTAQAGIVSYPLNAKVGFSTEYGSYTSFSLPGTAWIGVAARHGTSPGTSGGASWWWVNFFLRSVGTLGFKTGGSRLGIFSAGKTWSNAGGGTQTAVNIATRRYWWNSSGEGSNTGRDLWGNPSFDHNYALFRFYDTRSSDPADWKTEYGWLLLSHSMSNTTGPDVTLEGWAYEDTGLVIAAGDTGGVPEPSTMALAGLGALALGAAGLRRWRAARKQAA